MRERIDILFANEAEACALWGCDEVGAAVERARAEVAVACITLSEKGSVVVAGPETYEVPAHPVDVVDTTGAGDLYAAGFLFGYTTGRTLPAVRRAGVAGGGRGHQPHRRPPRGRAELAGPLAVAAGAVRPRSVQRTNWRRGATFRITRSDWIGLP